MRDGWQNNKDLDILCCTASRLFVHAAARVKFLDNKDRFSEVILGLPEPTYYNGKTCFDSNTTLGSPYTLILEAASSEGDLEVHSKITSTVGAVVLLVSPLPSPGIADLLVWIARRPRYSSHWFGRRLHSVKISTSRKNYSTTRFPDLTTDPSRCANTRFFVSPGYLHLEPVTNCLRAINDRLEQNLPSIPDYALNLEVKGLETRINHLSVTLWYACQSTQPPHQDQGRRRRCCLQHTCFLEEKFLA